MIPSKYLILVPLVLIVGFSSAQNSNAERLDSTISIFWNSKMKVRVKILNPAEPDTRNKNAVLTIYNSDQSSQRILFLDSLFAYTLQFRMIDMDGNGVNDLLIYNANNGQENRSYHLYLVDQNLEVLKRVKGFEKVFNPYFDQQECLIIGFESFEKKLILHRYQIDKNGNLSMTTWR